MSERARIVLLTAAGVGTLAIMRQVGCAKATFWRCHIRFMAEGVDRLSARQSAVRQGGCIYTRRWSSGWSSGRSGSRRARPPRWFGRAMAAAAGISLRSVQRIWAAHGLQPHSIKRFKLSGVPAFAAKLQIIVGLLRVDPPAHAVVLSVDEMGPFQALDRTQPGLPMKKGKAGTMTFDFKRNGTTTLFAAFDILDGTVIGPCIQRHRHQEFIRFLNAIERQVTRRQGNPRDPRQLRDLFLPQGAALTAPPHPRLFFHFHADLVLMAERGRDLLLLAHSTPPLARRVPLDRRPSGRHQPLYRGPQCRAQTLRIDRRSRAHPQQGRAREL